METRHSLAFILDQTDDAGSGGEERAATSAFYTSETESPNVMNGPQPRSTIPSSSPATSSDEELDARRRGWRLANEATTTTSTNTATPSPTASEATTTPVGTTRRRRQRPMSSEEKRIARQCSVDGCQNYTIDRGLCFRHGGGKTCSIEGCGRSAKARGLCWRHGGSVSCTVPGCNRGAKSRGLCWSHGGGTKCCTDGCEKTTISKGLCWTHGGGKRCSFDGCNRPASESKHNFCSRHHDELCDGHYVYEV